MPDESYSLACPFLTDDPVFARGVAFGMLWCRMRDTDEDEISEYIMTEISDQVRVAASRTGWELVEMKEWEHEGRETGWTFIRLARGGEPPHA